MIIMSRKLGLASFLIFFFFVSSVVALHLKGHNRRLGDYGDDEYIGSGFEPVVKSDERTILVDNEFGKISAVDVGDGIRGPYRIHFFTLEPNSLLLPTLLHADMVLFVHTGSGELNWVDEDETKTVKLRRGDIFRLQTGSVFFVQSDLETERQSLRIYALFSNTDNDLFNPEIGAYSSIRNLLRGFDKTTLRQAFKVPDEVIESITSATDAEAIVHAISTKEDRDHQKKKKKKHEKSSWDIEDRFLKAYLGGREENASNKKKKSKDKGFNMFEEDPDFENCNGWSLAVYPKKAERILGETNIGLFMVNLTKGSMMGPHWNPRATEIAIVLQGQGMIRVVCPSNGGNKTMSTEGSECKNRRFMVKEGDVFAVPRFHPMAQMSFNNDSFVFMGFSTTRRENRPQFLAGKLSVLQVLDEDILALSFNVPNTTVASLKALQGESVILECTSCAEEEERLMEEAAAARERAEEEARKREEEEKEREREKQRQEEEKERQRQEEEEREREKQRQEEEEKERQRQEEEEREREKKRQEEEEKERQRQEEEEKERERQRQEEDERQRQEEEEKDREKQRQEEEERQRQEEEEKERQRQEEEEREKQRQEEERQRQEEEEREKERQEEEERQRQEEEEKERQQQEEEQQRKEDEERQKEEEEGGGGGGGGEGPVFLKMWKG